MDIDVVAGVRHVDDVFAVESVDCFSESRAGLLGTQAVLVVLLRSGWLLDYGHWTLHLTFLGLWRKPS